MPSPFKTRSVANEIMAKRKSTGGVEYNPEESPDDNIGNTLEEPTDEEQPDEGLNAAARDLMDAIQNNDEAGVASAFRSAFQMLESEPHEEFDHNEDNQQPDEGQE